MLEPSEIEPLFTRKDGSFVFARWDRPIVPVIFGVDDTTLPALKGALEAVVTLAGHKMSDVDVELGANLMMFFVSDWAELSGVPNLERLVPDLAPLLDRLQAAEANQYRIFRFDEAGTIRAAFVFVRMDQHLAEVSAETLALSQAVQVILLWSDAAFAETSPLLAGPKGDVMLRPEFGALVRAAYDPVLPPVSRDPALAYRLSARMGRTA
ncbi:hypothetical protein [Flavimaricola marinus]|nr:hypothetical protein [Flavimaricola marinus]